MKFQKKAISAIAAATVFATSLMAFGEVKYPKVSLEKVKGVPALERHGIEAKKVYDTGDFYLVEGTQDIRGRKQATDIFMTKDRKYVIFGYVLDAKTGKKIEPFFDKETFKKAGLTIGSGKDDYYIFTDPSCPFCIKFEEMVEADPKLLKKIRLHVYFYPLTSIPGHEESPLKSMYIMSRKDPEAARLAMKRMMLEGDAAYKSYKPTPEDRERLALMRSWAAKLGVRGTPYLLDDRLRPIDDWKGTFADRYGVRLPVDARALRYLEKNVPGAVVAKGGPEKAYIFAEAGTPEAKRFFSSRRFEELKGTRELMLWPVAEEKNAESVIASAYILSASDRAESARRAREIFVEGKRLSEKEKRQIGKVIDSDANVSRNFGVIGFIKNKEGIGGGVRLYDENGKVIDAGDD